MTQELEFHISVTPVGGNEYLVRTERVIPGVPLAEEQVTWPVDEWLAQARHLMNDPLLGLLQENATLANGEALANIQGTKTPKKREQSYYPGQQEDLEADPGEAARAVNLVALGRHLYNYLFQGTLRDSWMTAQGIAQHRREVLRLRLGLKGNTLPRLPWEVLHAGNRPIATGTDVVFSRYQPPIKGVSQPPLEGHDKERNATTLKILMVLAAPTDQQSLELKREADHLKKELQSRSFSSAAGPAMQLTILDQPDRASLTQALEQSKYQVFHYAGHSNLGASGGELYLVSRTTGLTETLNGYDLAGLLANNGIQLAVFNSCRGAHAATSHPTDDTGERNLAEALVKRGIPAVLAMAERIPDDVALTLARLFYRNLSSGFAVDLSLSRARQGLISAYGSNQLYWALPILYLHHEFDGYLSSRYHVNSSLSMPDEDLSLPAARQARSPIPFNPQDADDFDLYGDYDDAEVEDTFDDLGYEDYGDEDVSADELGYDDLPDEEEASAFVAELFRKLDISDSATAERQIPPNDEEDFRESYQSAPVSKKRQLPATPINDRQRQPEPQNQRQPETENSPQAQVSVPKSPFRLHNSISKLAIGFVGISLLTLVGLWSFRDQIFQSKQPVADFAPATISPPPTENLNPSELKKASTPQVVANAVEQFNKGNLVEGQQAVEALLDRGALPQAKAALAALPNKQQDEPRINFLYGRLIWQFVQAGNKDYSIDDARRRWEASVRQQPNSSLSQTALGFAYYAEGNLNRAGQSWGQVLKLQQANSGTATKLVAGGNPQGATTTPTPDSSASRDSLTAYAGSALILMKSAKNLPPQQRGTVLSKAIKTRNYVMSQDPVNFQQDALAKNWMWSEAAIKDWQALLQLKEED
ncbi:CHAT domain-containing protein [Microcoleus sp. FACHB-68]|uniref:CHAT domain-containing protein n=1 Tax=Microcoleus sp. FACHB-68 TaxID=2692826 RepID=UPI0016891DB6|nr:CHAT domain-containing protein [Microcoleus sp. FACHB-68]